MFQAEKSTGAAAPFFDYRNGKTIRLTKTETVWFACRRSCILIKMPVIFDKHIERLGMGGLAVVYKADGTLRNGRRQRDLHKRPVFDLLPDKIFDDTAGTDTDPCKINDQIHGGDLQQMVGLYVLLAEIILNVGAADIAFFQHQDRTVFEYVGLESAFPEPHVGQVSGSGNEAVLDIRYLVKDDVFFVGGLRRQPQIDLLFFQKLQGLQGRLAVDGKFYMGVPGHKFLQAGEEHIFAQHSADTDTDVADAQLHHPFQLVFAVIQHFKGSADVFEKNGTFLCQLDSAGIADERGKMEIVLQLADGLADGRLADVKIFGGPGNVSGLGNLKENAV